MTTTEKCADGREHLYLCSTCGKHGPEDAEVERLKAKLEEAKELLGRTRETLNCVAAELPIDMVLAAINELDTFLGEKP